MKIVFSVLFAFCTLFLAAQNNQNPVEFDSPSESPTLLPPANYTTPPNVPVRTMAEWEELQALVVTWQGQSAILTEIVRNARQECKVIICCSSQNTVNSAKNYLTTNNVDWSTNVEFVVIPNNSIWVRDYGPNTVYANNVDSLYFIDWIYNRPNRPLDNDLPIKLGQHMNIPVYSTNTAPYAMVNTGGNFMVDGLGTAFASRLILDENLPNNPYGTSGQSEAGINNIMQEFMGINRYIKMNVLPYDQIHHIDMHMKLLDDQTLLVGQYPPGIADGPQIEANIQYVLSNYTTAYGTPYKIIRIPMPPEGGAYPNTNGDYRTYANAVFVNKTVILPTYEQTYDTTALRIWREALPGYKVVGINCNNIIGSSGAIHCITKEVGVADPIQIAHRQLTCQDNSTQLNYPVSATFRHISGIAGAKIYYTTDTAGVWLSTDMVAVGDTVDYWEGAIPLQPAGSTVYYYLQVIANNGHTLARPMPAPKGWWKFCVTQTNDTEEPSTTFMEPVFPNPASAITCIPVTLDHTMKGSIKLYNTLGQCLETIYNGTFPAGSSKYFLHADQYPTGTYWISLEADGIRNTQKLLIK